MPKPQPFLRNLERSAPDVQRTILAQLVDALDRKHKRNASQSVKESFLDFMLGPTNLGARLE